MHAGTHTLACKHVQKHTRSTHMHMHTDTHLHAFTYTYADAHNVKGDEAYKSVDLKLLLSDPKIFHNFVVALN